MTDVLAAVDLPPAHEQILGLLALWFNESSIYMLLINRCSK